MSSPIYSVTLVTAPDKKTADKIAEGLIERQLAGCVNIVAGVSSVYRWEEKIQHSDEFLLVIKTKMALIPEITEFVKQNHPYSVPEVIGFPVHDGYQTYLDWLGANTVFTKPKRMRGGRPRF